ncbi:MAG: J domain-containing protein [Actinomycetes bacterium]
MGHYAVLGVPEGADPASVRRAYLELAREHHPDLHPAGAARRAAERRMQEVNEAWAVLSDPDRRLAYDRRLGLVAGDPADGPSIVRPSTEFTPYFEVDEDDDDSWRFEPDEYDPRTAIGRGLSVAPVLCGALGAAALVGAAMLNLRQLVAVGVGLLVLSGLLFVGAPVVAMFKSQHHENRPSAPRR